MNFTYSAWIELPLNTRHKICEVLGIKKIRPTHVSSNKVVDDGYNIKDIETALSLQNLQDYLGTTINDIDTLWTLLIDKVEGKVQHPTLVIPEEVLEVAKTMPSVLVPKKRGRPKKNENKTT